VNIFQNRPLFFPEGPFYAISLCHHTTFVAKNTTSIAKNTTSIALLTTWVAIHTVFETLAEYSGYKEQKPPPLRAAAVMQVEL